jgi:hypothetical protein
MPKGSASLWRVYHFLLSVMLLANVKIILGQRGVYLLCVPEDWVEMGVKVNLQRVRIYLAPYCQSLRCTVTSPLNKKLSWMPSGDK